MGAEELRMKTEDQLKGDLANLKKEAFNLRFQQANGQLENTARVRSVRREIARINTFLGQKAAATAGSAPKPAAEAKPAPKAKAKKVAKPQADKSGAEASEKKAAKKPKTTTPKAKKAAAKKTAKAKA